MKKLKNLFLAALLIGAAFLFIGCSSEPAKEEAPAPAQEETTYSYIKADELKADIESKKPMILLDIQVKEDFDAHHIDGAIPTYAYPVETDEQKAMLEAVVPELKASTDPIVIICPGGGKGATRTYDYLLTKGIDAKRLVILENGQKGWPFDELLAK